MARSHEPPNGSDHHVQNGVKARRAAIVLFIVATFGIVAILSFPLARNVRLPPGLRRPLQAALSPAERLIRPIIPWLGPLPGSFSAPRRPGRAIAAPPRTISRPTGSRPGAPPPVPPPPSVQPPPGPPGTGTGTVRRPPTTRLPGSGTVGDGVRRPPTNAPSSGIGEGKATARGHSGEKTAKQAKPKQQGKHQKRAKHQKQAKHVKRPRHGKHEKRAKRRKQGTLAANGTSRKKG